LRTSGLSLGCVDGLQTSTVQVVLSPVPVGSRAMEDETSSEELADEPPQVTIHGRAVLILPRPSTLAMTSSAARRLAQGLLDAAQKAEENS
jgi:hypothetical protein